MIPEHELYGLIGLEGVRLIQQRYHGQRVYIPRQFPSDHPMVKILGEETAKKLSEKHPATMLTVTRSLLLKERNQTIITQRRQGQQPGQVARRFGLTARTVRKICQGIALKPSLPTRYGCRARARRAATQG
jgi:DNA-binding NarL/FixJ family response regulator